MKNELSTETSPYLLQHANNPVHWQPWNNATLQLAKNLNKPILVSIGYSACHWCHVMEKESFENEATAALMNEFFINIKIDREERPDIDHIYMDAVQAMTGSGGWPLNVFLTPDAKPFYGGTYFPPTKAYGRASWTDVLINIRQAWTTKQSEMQLQAETLVAHLEKSNNYAQLKSSINIEIDKPIFSKDDCIEIAQNLLTNADTLKGGFGKAPKFPQIFSINCLLQLGYLLKNNDAVSHAELCLTKMLDGGIYDQLGGGLCRYSTDENWLAPHFEKMLYDNALFVASLSDAFLLTKKEKYKVAVEEVCHFILTEMKNPNGGYYAAIDADSEGVEGKFYVWDKAEIDEALGSNAALFNTYFNVLEQGNWEEKNILHINKSLKEIATLYSLTTTETFDIIKESKEKLLTIRNQRIHPTTDDKILLGWNALLITAFCKSYAITQNDVYKNAAEELYNFLIKVFYNKKEESFFHTYKNGEAKFPAFLDDYAYLINACIHLQEITGNEHYLTKAKTLVEFVNKNFTDEKTNFYFFTSIKQTDVIIRKIEIYDGATASANSIMAKNLHYLSIIFNNKKWHHKVFTMIESLKTIIVKHPNSFAVWASSAINIAVGINEISIIGNNMMPELQKVLLEYLPNKIVVSAKQPSLLPILLEKTNFENNLLYLCLNNECKAPFVKAKELLISIQNHTF